MEAILEVDEAQILEELDSEVDTAGVVVGVVADDDDIAAAVLAGAIDAVAAAAAAAVAGRVGRGSGGAGETADAGDDVDVRADGGAGVYAAGETAGEEEAKNSGHRAE